MKQGDKPALVGIVPRKELWPIIRKERWYHIPVASAPRTIKTIRYLNTASRKATVSTVTT